MAMLCVDDNSL